MNYLVKRQETYSRGELLLRSFLGWLYIMIPHIFVMYFYMIGFMFSRIATFFTILFTGKFPKKYFDFQVKVLNYMQRVNCTFYNMLDGYPSFSLNENDPRLIYQPVYKENVGVGRLLVRSFFGGLMLFPHLFILIFRIYGALFVSIAAWFVVLFTGEFPENMFNFIEGTFRWNLRLTNYLYFYTDDYPEFTGKIVEGENVDMGASTQDHLITE